MLLDLNTDFSGGRSGGLVFHLFKNFQKFVVIHTVKGFDVVNKAEIDVFLELSCFFDDPVDVDSLMSGSNCCILTCIQISQEADKVVWYSHLLQTFPQFVVIHTVKGFGIVNKAEVDVFLEISCLFDDPTDVGNLISGSSAFSKTSLNIWKFTIHVLLKPGLENLSITLLVCEMSAIVKQFEHCLALPFFGIGMKTDLFQSCGHC